MGSTVTRKRGTKEYLYYVWYDNRHDKTHIHSHSLTFTHIHSHSLTFTHIHSHSLTFTHISKRIEKYCGLVNGKNTIKNLTRYKKEELTVQSEGFKAKLQELERLSLKQ